MYRAYWNLGNEVHWVSPEMTEPTGEGYQGGYEVLFLRETGVPTALPVIATYDHGEPIYTKRIPRGLARPGRYVCSLHKRALNTNEYQSMGFEECGATPFLNFANWEEHVSTFHGDFVRSLNAMKKQDVMSGLLWEQSGKAAANWEKVRRASDPRLQAAEPTTKE